MSGERDPLLDALTDVKRQKAMYEASLTLAADLLIEWYDEDLDAEAVPRLKAATRSFLLNVPVGTVSRPVEPLPDDHPDSAQAY